jgi:hypothetical protein
VFGFPTWPEYWKVCPSLVHNLEDFGEDKITCCPPVQRNLPKVRGKIKKEPPCIKPDTLKY